MQTNSFVYKLFICIRIRRIILSSLLVGKYYVCLHTNFILYKMYVPATCCDCRLSVFFGQRHCFYCMSDKLNVSIANGRVRYARWVRNFSQSVNFSQLIMNLSKLQRSKYNILGFNFKPNHLQLHSAITPLLILFCICLA